MSELVAIEQKEVEFYGDELTAIRASDGKVYASLRHLCQALGVDTHGQQQRITRHLVLAEGLMVCKLHTIQGERDTYVLRVDLIPLWLSGIRASAVNEEVRPKLVSFQKEAASVLWEAFQDGRLTADPNFDDLLEKDSDAVQAYKMLAAMTRIARQQVILESRVVSIEARLEDVEARLAPPSHVVSNSQASQVSQAVKAVGLAYGKQTGRNEFGAVYGEMYRKFEVTSYKLIPAAKFEAVMRWLSDWYQALTNEELPF
jgi:hypothetical protein